MYEAYINLGAVILNVIAEFALALSLSVAAARNHFKGHIRPIVGILALYFWSSAAMSFLRVITRVFVMNGGDSRLFVDSPWYLVGILLNMVMAWVLYFTLVKSYSGALTTHSDGSQR